jgi:hypothetical protein
MTAASCDWRRCEQTARLAVLIGEVLEAAERVGVYCLRHATIKRRVVEQQKRVTVWLDWHGPPRMRRKVVGAGPDQRVLHRHVQERLTSRS